jgi:LDH2 family malate/lactate/ureidoglycolate dehydrogenase
MYPTVDSDVLIAHDALLARVTAIFRRCGMNDRHAALLADTLVTADARGVMRVPDYVGKLTLGGVNPRGRPKVVRQKGAGMVVDGDNAMGQIACEFAIREALARAADLGVCVARFAAAITAVRCSISRCRRCPRR